MNIIVLIGVVAIVLANPQWFRDISDELARLERRAKEQ